MARRRMMGYGSEAPQKAGPGRFPVPPPPDGKPPVRLPIGAPDQPQPQGQPMPQQGQPNDDELMQQIMQMLQQTERG